MFRVIQADKNKRLLVTNVVYVDTLCEEEAVKRCHYFSLSHVIDKGCNLAPPCTHLGLLPAACACPCDGLISYSSACTVLHVQYSLACSSSLSQVVCIWGQSLYSLLGHSHVHDQCLPWSMLVEAERTRAQDGDRGIKWQPQRMTGTVGESVWHEVGIRWRAFSLPVPTISASPDKKKRFAAYCLV